jgi:hypothetical protein
MQYMARCSHFYAGMKYGVGFFQVLQNTSFHFTRAVVPSVSG